MHSLGRTAVCRPRRAGGTPLLLIALLLSSGICLAAAGATSAGAEHRRSQAGPRGRAAASSHLQVTQVEYRIALSTTTVKAGAVNLLQLDRGSEPHDLRLRREGSGAVINGRLLMPGKRWEGVVELAPGVYRLWCSLPEHAARGMHTTLRVVR
jgi:hypothetical protein